MGMYPSVIEAVRAWIAVDASKASTDELTQVCSDLEAAARKAGVAGDE